MIDSIKYFVILWIGCCASSVLNASYDRATYPSSNYFIPFCTFMTIVDEDLDFEIYWTPDQYANFIKSHQGVATKVLNPLYRDAISADLIRMHLKVMGLVEDEMPSALVAECVKILRNQSKKITELRTKGVINNDDYKLLIVDALYYVASDGNKNNLSLVLDWINPLYPEIAVMAAELSSYLLDVDTLPEYFFAVRKCLEHGMDDPFEYQLMERSVYVASSIGKSFEKGGKDKTAKEELLTDVKDKGFFEVDRFFTIATLRWALDESPTLPGSHFDDSYLEDLVKVVKINKIRVIEELTDMLEDSFGNAYNYVTSARYCKLLSSLGEEGVQAASVVCQNTLRDLADAYESGQLSMRGGGNRAFVAMEFLREVDFKVDETIILEYVKSEFFLTRLSAANYLADLNGSLVILTKAAHYITENPLVEVPDYRSKEFLWPNFASGFIEDIDERSFELVNQ